MRLLGVPSRGLAIAPFPRKVEATTTVACRLGYGAGRSATGIHQVHMLLAYFSQPTREA